MSAPEARPATGARPSRLRLPRLGGRHFTALSALPRDGRPVGDLDEKRGPASRGVLDDLAAWGFVVLWPMRGWTITEAGIRALDTRDAVRHRRPAEATP